MLQYTNNWLSKYFNTYSSMLAPMGSTRTESCAWNFILLLLALACSSAVVFFNSSKVSASSDAKQNKTKWVNSEGVSLGVLKLIGIELLQQQNHKSLWRELLSLQRVFSSLCKLLVQYLQRGFFSCTFQASFFWLQWWSLVCNANKLSFFVLPCSIIFV